MAIVNPEGSVKEATAAEVGGIWLQPGAESQSVLDQARGSAVNFLAGGPCVLVELGLSDDF